MKEIKPPVWPKIENVLKFPLRYREAKKNRLKRKHARIMNSEDEGSDLSDVEIDDDFKCPAAIWNKLYRCVLVINGPV